MLETTLRDSMILRVELKRDGVPDGRADISGTVLKLSIDANNNLVV